VIHRAKHLGRRLFHS